MAFFCKNSRERHLAQDREGDQGSRRQRREAGDRQSHACCMPRRRRRTFAVTKLNGGSTFNSYSVHLHYNTGRARPWVSFPLYAVCRPAQQVERAAAAPWRAKSANSGSP